jgi:hypothetical protein
VAGTAVLGWLARGWLPAVWSVQQAARCRRLAPLQCAASEWQGWGG